MSMTSEQVTAARLIANLEVENEVLSENLTATQERCTQLIEENRKLKEQLEYGFDSYQKDAARTRNNELSHIEAMHNIAYGLTGEVGEVVDVLKKSHFKGQPLDLEKLKGELGDLLWYFADACTTLGISMSDVAKANIEKLRLRHPNGFEAPTPK